MADEAVYQVIDNLFGELAEIFPDPYVHIGGDEVLPGWWLKSDAVAAFMQRHELGDAVALQAHFNARVAALAAGHGKRLIGWDEVLNGGAPAGMVVQAWRGATARDRALAAGHACVESSGYYLDLFFPADVHHAWDPRRRSTNCLAKKMRCSKTRVFSMSQPACSGRITGESRLPVHQRAHRPDVRGPAMPRLRCSGARPACGRNWWTSGCCRCACGRGCRQSPNGYGLWSRRPID